MQILPRTWPFGAVFLSDVVLLGVELGDGIRSLLVGLHFLLLSQTSKMMVAFGKLNTQQAIRLLGLLPILKGSPFPYLSASRTDCCSAGSRDSANHGFFLIQMLFVGLG